MHSKTLKITTLKAPKASRSNDGIREDSHMDFLQKQRLRAMGLAAILLGGTVASTAIADTQPREGLVLECRFEGNAIDSSGSQRHGTIHGRPRFAAGKSGQCIVLDGRQDYIDCGAVLASLGPAFTVEFWVNPAESQQSNANLFGNHYHGALGLTVEQDGGNTNRFAAHFGAGSGRWISTRTMRLLPGKWQHVAVVKTPQELRLYRNGVPVAATRDAAPVAASPISFRIGQSLDSTSRCFGGMLDEFRVWNKAIDDFRLDLTPRETAETFAGALNFTIRVTPPSTSPPGGPTIAQVAVDETLVPLIPKSVNEVVLSFQAEELLGNSPGGIPPLRLNRGAGFRGQLDYSWKPGCYQLTYTPTIPFGSECFEGAPASATIIVPTTDAEASPLPASDGAQFRTPQKSTQVLSLDGPQWSIAKDAKNAGRRALVLGPDSGGQADPRPVDHPGRLPRVSRDRVVLARVHGPGQPARGRPLPLALSRRGLRGRSVGQRGGRGRARGRRDSLRARRDPSREARRGESPGRPRAQSHA